MVCISLVLGRVFLSRFKSGYGISIEKCDIKSHIGIWDTYLTSDMRYEYSRLRDSENVPKGLFRYKPAEKACQQMDLLFDTARDSVLESNLKVWREIFLGMAPSANLEHLFQ